MYIEYNPNPEEKKTDDCTIRALSKALNLTWSQAFAQLAAEAYKQKDMMHKNYVWGNVLMNNGFSRHSLPNTCPQCYTIADFAADHPKGTFVVGTGDHVVTIVDGDWWDSWDSGGQVPIVYYWRSYAI